MLITFCRRERVKRRRAQSSSEVTQSPVEAPTDGNQQPDLAEISKDLPSGWQVNSIMQMMMNGNYKLELMALKSLVMEILTEHCMFSEASCTIIYVFFPIRKQDFPLKWVFNDETKIRTARLNFSWFKLLKKQ